MMPELGTTCQYDSCAKASARIGRVPPDIFKMVLHPHKDAFIPYDTGILHTEREGDLAVRNRRRACILLTYHAADCGRFRASSGFRRKYAEVFGSWAWLSWCDFSFLSATSPTRVVRTADLVFNPSRRCCH